MKRVVLALSIALTSLVVTHRSAEAGPGLRFGITDDPDTLSFGFFSEHVISRLGRTSFLSLEPGIDVGIDPDVDLLTVRGTFNFKFLFLTGRAALYPLVGISLYYWNYDNGPDDTGVGLNLGGGVQVDRFSFELWFGVDDIPDITFLFGIAI
jgi:hypothetical protein